MATAKGKRKHVPPSRRQYEATHRTVSARLDAELQHELDLLKSESGMSTADIIRIGLDKAKPDLEASFQKGVEVGFERSREKYEVPYECSECGRWHLSISTLEEKVAVAEYMSEHGWHHEDCEKPSVEPTPFE